MKNSPCFVGPEVLGKIDLWGGKVPLSFKVSQNSDEDKKFNCNRKLKIYILHFSSTSSLCVFSLFSLLDVLYSDGCSCDFSESVQFSTLPSFQVVWRLKSSWIELRDHTFISISVLRNWISFSGYSTPGELKRGSVHCSSGKEYRLWNILLPWCGFEMRNFQLQSRVLITRVSCTSCPKVAESDRSHFVLSYCKTESGLMVVEPLRFSNL